MKKCNILRKFNSKFHIGLSFFILIFVFIFSRKLLFLINYFLALAFHEMAHLLVATKRGYKLKYIHLDMFGLSVDLNENVDHSDIFAVAIAGPVCNLFLCLVCLSLYWLIPNSFSVLNNFCLSNFALAIFNLIPVYPLDGGKLLRGQIKSDKKYFKLDKIIRFSLSIMFLIIFFITIKNMNLFWLLMAVFFIISVPEYTPNFSVIKPKNKHIEKVDMLRLTGEETLFDVLKKIMPNRYIIFYLNNGKNTYIDEDKIVNFALKYPLETRIGKLI